MTARRYYARFAGREGFEERYEVFDGSINEPVSAKLPYHEANDQADARNRGEFEPTAALIDWLPGCNFNG